MTQNQPTTTTSHHHKRRNPNRRNSSSSSLKYRAKSYTRPSDKPYEYKPRHFQHNQQPNSGTTLDQQQKHSAASSEGPRNVRRYTQQQSKRDSPSPTQHRQLGAYPVTNGSPIHFTVPSPPPHHTVAKPPKRKFKNGSVASGSKHSSGRRSTEENNASHVYETMSRGTSLGSAAGIRHQQGSAHEALTNQQQQQERNPLRVYSTDHSPQANRQISSAEFVSQISTKRSKRNRKRHSEAIHHDLKRKKKPSTKRGRSQVTSPRNRAEGSQSTDASVPVPEKSQSPQKKRSGLLSGRRHSHASVLGARSADPFFQQDTKTGKLLEMMERLDRIEMTIHSTRNNYTKGKIPRKIKQLMQMPDFSHDQVDSENDTATQRNPSSTPEEMIEGTAESNMTAKDQTAAANSYTSAVDSQLNQTSEEQASSPPHTTSTNGRENHSRSRKRKIPKEERLRKLDALLLEEKRKREAVKRQQEALRRRSLSSHRSGRRSIFRPNEQQPRVSSSVNGVLNPVGDFATPRLIDVSVHRPSTQSSSVSTSQDRANALDEKIQQAQMKKELLQRRREQNINQQFFIRKNKMELNTKKALSKKRKETFIKSMEHLERQQENYIRSQFIMKQKKAKRVNKLQEQEQKLTEQEKQLEEAKRYIEKQKRFLQSVASAEKRQMRKRQKKTTLGVYRVSDDLSPKKRMQNMKKRGRSFEAGV